MDSDRLLQLEGVHNFRDYGGYAIVGGGRLKRGALWRSGQHFEATDADLAAITGLGLSDVFDLRSDRERQSHPCRRPIGFTGEIHIVSDASLNTAPHIAAIAGSRRDAEITRANMRTNYQGIPYRPKLIEMIRNMLLRVSQGEGASLVNCMAGKDRTGFAVAMLHHALGVHRDDIVADYLLTNSAGDQAARIASGKRTVNSTLGAIDDEALKVLMGVESEYLEAAFAAIAENQGALDTYQAEFLGVDAVLRDRLRERLSEG